MPQPIIKLKDLDVTYNPGKENEYKANTGVNMEIYPEECVAFFGPSGCGKSTLFYCILGVLPPSAGQILVKGENPYTFSPERMVKFQTRTIGIIYQAFYLINSISVIDNVALPQIFHGVSAGRRRRWSKQLLRRFGMDIYSEKFPDNLSGGQSQRVSVARALVNNPDVLLADEPTGNLDSISTLQVMEALEEINSKDKKTVIMITHNAAQLKYCHRVFYMKDGRVERVVPNPEKKQIAKIDRQSMMVTELDILSKIYPYATPAELKTKSIVNYLTQGISIEQVVRLEKIVGELVERKADADKLWKVLATPYDRGGVGIGSARARTMTDTAARILAQSEDIQRYRRRLEQNMFYEREHTLLARITKYLSEQCTEAIVPVQARRLKELVYSRMSGMIRKEEFQAGLRLKIDEGGLGLADREAHELTYYFEKVITQGTETKGHGH